jgi:putative transposase
MTIACCRQISLQDTPYYHVVSRCVRRAFLCGEDAHSGQSYEHRSTSWVSCRECLPSVSAPMP